MVSSYPYPNPMKSFWIEEGPSTLKKHRTTNKLPAETDVVIIGSGYSGTSVACGLLLSKSSVFRKRPSVVMLEARDVCSGATGRNGGHIRSFYHSGHKHFVDQVGEKKAAEMVMFEHDELSKIENLVKKYEINCNFDPRLSCQTVDDPRVYQSSLDNYYAFQNNKYIPQSIKDCVKIRFVPEADEVSEHKAGPFCITAPTCSIWPYKLITCLLRKCIDTGLNLQTYTMVENLKPTSDGGWIVSTARGPIKCKKVVCATNAWTRALLPEFKDKIVPVKGVVSHIRPTSKNPGKLNFNYYHTFPIESDYVTAHTDMSMIAGGGGPTYLNYPNSVDMFNNCDDTYAPKDALDYFKDYPNKYYPEFAKGLKFVNDYTWTGCMAYSNDEFPFVGDMTPFGRKNLYIIAGFTGHGMPRIWSCGEYVSGLVDGSKRGRIPEVFKNTVDRMYSSNFELFNEIAGYDVGNRGKFKL
ncbi:hypothetical protein PMKS-000311 [Pichia membranifaciens]|uniref:FAD dependent oxidoreductase domain-containing protein n=1 Tax=Pichia membranifaciens TaxID=4926 RepID=A0A1Q2YBD8_9ASCO|nr:hypothetical protein PMKS-000311 [Pichia membranifaciens]